MFRKVGKYNPQLAATQQNFQEFYKQNLQSIYGSLEKDRQDNLYILERNTAIVILVITVVVSLFYFDILPLTVLDQQWFGIVSSIFLLIAGGMIYHPFQRYNGQTKSRTMNKILSFWGNFKYSNSSDIIGADTIKKSELFSYFNRSESEDAFSGSYKKTAISVSEHDLRIHGNKGDTIMFKGVMLLLDFKQRFKSKTVVLNKGRTWNMMWNNPLLMLLLPLIFAPWLMCCYFLRKTGFSVEMLFVLIPALVPFAVIGIIYLIYRHFHPKKATKKVVLEGLSFLKNWQVLTEDQVEARYILTPVFMEKILEIKRLFHGKYIDFSFFGSKLLIAVHTRKDLFETTSLFVPALSYHKVREVVSQLHSIFAVIDVITDDKNMQ